MHRPRICRSHFRRSQVRPPVISTSPQLPMRIQCISTVLTRAKHAPPALFTSPVSPREPLAVLKKSGYNDYSTTANIVAGTTADIGGLQPASAKPATASAEIYSQPSGADVYINNAYKGVTPLSFENVPIDTTKTYSIELRLEGYKPYTDSGSIGPGQNVIINAALTPLARRPLSLHFPRYQSLQLFSFMGLLSVILTKKR